MLFRITIPSFCVPKRYLPSRRNLRWSCASGQRERLADLVDCEGYVWSILQEMSENANASVVSSSVFITQSWLIFVTLLARLHNRGRQRFALVVTESQDVQNVLDVSLTWCNVTGVRVSSRSRRTEVTVLSPWTHWFSNLQLEPCTKILLEPRQFHIAP